MNNEPPTIQMAVMACEHSFYAEVASESQYRE